MTKGFWGEGGGHSGNINDEDWGLEDGEMPYSNTLGPASSTIRYLTADIGYNVLLGPGYRISPFVGYSYFSQGMSDFGGVNIAFVPPQQEAPGVGLQQFTTWNGLRLGAAADLMLTPRLTLSADAAWLPDVRFEGLEGPRRENQRRGPIGKRERGSTRGDPQLLPHWSVQRWRGWSLLGNVGAGRRDKPAQWFDCGSETRC
jgi:hypothetical protein